MPLVPGMKVRYLPQPEWGVGHLVQLFDAGTKAQVLFPTREEPVLVSTKQQALVAQPLSIGDRIRTAKGKTGNVIAEVEGGRGLRRYVLALDGGGEDELPESELRALPPKPDLLSMLREGRVADSHGFLLRKQALVLDDERRCDALGALFASRVMVKPHQVGVVQRVLSSRRPRFILADEVGLGKTIEAGMVFSALRLSGLANRVLVVAPSHLTVQWLVEFFHKFNQLFTLMDSDRYESSLKEAPDASPWERFPRIITSLELLSRTDDYLEETGAKSAYWDLVIFDEAHHLKSERAFAAARALAANSWGLLLLTATPMQLDPEEYHGLLSLIDPSTAPTLAGFRERLARQEELSASVRELSGGKAAAAVKALAKRFPGDERLKSDASPAALLAHLAETYSLSDRLIRNRRAVVGGFAERRLHRHEVKLSAPEKKARQDALDVLRKQGLRGAALADLVRRLESSPAAVDEAAKGNKSLAALKDAGLPQKDAKLHAFIEVLQGIWKGEPKAKVLVFTESRATLEFLRGVLREERVEALGYHGDLPLVERDRQVARFRDPDGPKVLICTEVGGEGRNFQFSHHLINYNIPWSPAAMEQRIGRLDRIGQTQTVELHAFDPQGTFSSDVLGLLADAVGVFGETVGGLDAVLEEVEPKLAELSMQPARARGDYARDLAARVKAARFQAQHAYDPLLDTRSFDRVAVEGLVARAHERLGLDAEDGASLEDGLWALSRDLDERLEDTVTELARKIGLGVDTDEQVDAFQAAFHFGHALKVEALPGIDVQQERTILGTFWRDTAVDQEEIEYFATGHALVEALFGFLRDGPFGRNGFRFIEKRGPLKARGIEFLFHVIPPEPADTSPGARVPSRQLSRFVGGWLLQVAVVQGADGKPKLDSTLESTLEAEGRTLRTDEVTAAFPGFAQFVDAAVPVAQAGAEARKTELMRSARAAI
ncbi:MAG TPA: SNF2-related protein, partial [Myxococcaceae bacterium]|nr:SNF2-related protein [Myxococcaceae bacterium]